MKCPECGEEGNTGYGAYLNDSNCHRVSEKEATKIGYIEKCKNGHKFGRAVKKY